jgi:predicted transcriptional regulator
MKTVDVRIPCILWERIEQRAQVISIRLESRRIIPEVYVNKCGIIEGVVIGGQDGISKMLIDFKEDDIVAIKPAEGLRSRLGLRRWIK